MKISGRFIITGLIVIGIFVITYFIIKNQNPPEITIEEIGEKPIQGIYFNGDWEDKRLQKYYALADSLAKTNSGLSSAMYYNDPYEDDGAMECFIGIETQDSLSLSVFSEKRIFEEGLCVKAVIKGNMFDIPRRIYMDMEDFAEDNGYTIGELSLEQYFSDTLMVIYTPLKDGK